MIFLQILALFYVFWVPGLLLIWHIDHTWDPWVAWLVALLVGSLSMPMLSFCVAWILGTHLSPLLVLAVASVVNIPGAFWAWLRIRRANDS